MKLNVKKLIPILYAVAAVCVLGGIALFAFAVPHAASLFFGLFIGIFAGLCILLGGLILYFIYVSSDNDANFFLYDRKTGKNIDPEELTFDRINSRMGYFMTLISSSHEQLWSKNVLEQGHERFGHHEVYKPLVAYKMLYDLSELDRPETWQLFTGADPAIIRSLCETLRTVGEDTMAKTLEKAYESAADVADVEWVRDFLMGNAKYIRRRMLDYIRKNLEWFY